MLLTHPTTLTHPTSPHHPHPTSPTPPYMIWLGHDFQRPLGDCFQSQQALPVPVGSGQPNAGADPGGGGGGGGGGGVNRVTSHPPLKIRNLLFKVRIICDNLLSITHLCESNPYSPKTCTDCDYCLPRALKVGVARQKKVLQSPPPFQIPGSATVMGSHLIEQKSTISISFVANH